MIDIQLSKGLAGLSAADAVNLVIAYEPVRVEFVSFSLSGCGVNGVNGWCDDVDEGDGGGEVFE